MDFQTLIVLLIIGVACAYVGRIVWKKVKATGKNATCDVGCGCSGESKSPLTNIKSLKSR